MRPVLADALFLISRTLRITVPTVIEATAGRLTQEACDRRLDWWSKDLVEEAGMRLEIKGADRVDWSRRYVVMSNHQSYFDIPVALRAVRGSLRFVAKKELFRIPIFGPAMRAAGMVSIDRGNRESAIDSLKVAGERLADGVHIWIAPEGTRSRDGRLGTLKKGGFVLAESTGTPILPLALSGTRNVLPRGTKEVQRGVPVTATFGAPLEVQGTSRDGMMDAVRQFFVDHVEGAE
jgi:1-acyl-sn-glycerol-3-phosphate acyltransferase